MTPQLLGNLMLLCIDVGNTNMVMGLYDAENLVGNWRLETKKERTADEFGIFIKELLNFSHFKLDMISNIVISNVVPTLTYTLREMCKKYFQIEPFCIDAAVKSPLKINLDQPKEIGADRIVNAVAVFAEYKTDCIIIDFGTATTFDVVTKEGGYEGGIICPGIKISSEALFHRASKLPRVEIIRPEHVIGKNTIECMQAGLFFGYVGMVDSLVERIQEETGKEFTVVATGGLAHVINKGSKTIDHVDDLLTLKGLRFLWKYNQ